MRVEGWVGDKKKEKERECVEEMKVRGRLSWCTTRGSRSLMVVYESSKLYVTLLVELRTVLWHTLKA